MKEFNARKSTRLKSFDYDSASAYFITICTKDRKCLLSQIVGTGVLDCPNVALTHYGEIAEKYIHQLNDFYPHIFVDAFVIMPNHVHLLLVIEDSGQSRTPVPTRANNPLSLFVSTFKRFCNKEYGQNIWQSRSHDHIIRNAKDYEEHFRYIEENPIRWELDTLYEKE